MSYTDDVPANNTIWVLGDAILTDAAGHYNYFKKLKDSNGPEHISNQLFMESMYAIRIVSPGLYTAKQARNTPNIILNSLVDTLNTKAKVPHTLVIMMNDHRFWNDRVFLDLQMDRILCRFIKEIRRIVEARNLSLPPRAVNWDYPRIFLTRPLPLPNNMSKPYPKGFKSNRKKFNRLLQKAEEQLDYKSICMSEFTSENENKFFSDDGAITQKGYRNIWTTISDAIHKSDNQNRINLNKAKAKQLAAAIVVSKSEMKDNTDTLSDCDSDMSDVLHIQDKQPSKAKATKRALIKEFDASDENRKEKDASQRYTNVNRTSPHSEISVYYTSRHTHDQPRQYHAAPTQQPRSQYRQHRDHYRHQPPYKKKRSNKRQSNWRNQNPIWRTSYEQDDDY